MSLILNFILFQAGWFTSVIGAAQGYPLAGPVATVIAVAVHLRFAKRPISEFLLVAACAGIGVVFDSILVYFDWVAYPSGMFHPELAPYWIVGMWMLFATTLNVSLGWLRGRWWLSAVLGLIAGPMSYVAGQKLGGIEFLDQTAALAALGVGWALMLPFLSWLAQTLDGVSKSRSPSVIFGESA